VDEKDKTVSRAPGVFTRNLVRSQVRPVHARRQRQRGRSGTRATRSIAG